MAKGVDLFLEGLKGASGDIQSGVESFQQGQLVQDKREDTRRRREREDEILDTRLQNEQDINTLAIDIQDPNFSEEDFVQRTAPISGRAARTGDQAGLQALDDIRSLFSRRRAQEAEALKLKTTKKKEAKKEEVRVGKASANLAKDFASRKAVENSRKTEAQLKKVKSFAKLGDGGSKIADVGLITATVKSFDDGARVTDNDFRQGEKARAWMATMPTNENGEKVFLSDSKDKVVIPAFLISFIQQLRPNKGTKMLPQQRQQFVDAAQAQFEGTLEQRALVEDEFDALSEVQGVDSSLFIRQRAREKLKKIQDDRAAKGAQEAPERGKKTKLSLDQERSVLTSPKNQKNFKAFVQRREAKLGRRMTPEEKADQVIKGFDAQNKTLTVGREDLIADFRAEDEAAAAAAAASLQTPLPGGP